MNTEFSKEELKKLFESVLPGNISTKEFRTNINGFVGRMYLADNSPKGAFDKACLDANLKSALKMAYPHKFDVDFYDLICICILLLNQDDKMLCNFLCTEILQTSSDSFCKETSVSILQNIINEQTERENAYKNNGIHSSLTSKVVGYDKLKEFLDASKEKFAEMEVEYVKFNDTKIEIQITSWAEYVYGDDMEFATDYPVGTIKLELENVDRIISDTWGWKELRDGSLEILPNKMYNDDSIDFSFIKSFTGTPFFKFRCKKISILEYTPSGCEMD